MKFPQMPYKRPDIEAMLAELKSLEAQLRDATDFAQADTAFLALDKLNRNAQTLIALAQARHTIDTNDAFYDAEVQFLDEQTPVLTEGLQAAAKALFASPFRADFAAKYGELLIKNIEIELKTFSPEIIPELQEENRLSTEYDKLLASAQIPFEFEGKGGTYTLSQLTPFKEDKDDAKRRAAWIAEGGFYTGHGETLDRLYGDLVALRHKMAQKLGYKNFVELGYYRMTRNSYTRQDVDKFREAIVKHIVPVASRLYRQQAERTGLPYPLSFADAALTFRSGNARPFGTPEQILEHGKKFYHELSPRTAEFIDFMLDNELLDVLSRKGKSGGGYCTTFPDYKAPFIFANFNGTAGDVDVITHEAGHAFAAFVARDIVPLQNQNPTAESCEIHSMAMEFFAWPWVEGFFGGDTAKYRYGHLAGALTFLPYGTMVDHYQHIVYDHPELTPAQRHAKWRKLLGVYMPWLRLNDGNENGIPFYGEGKGWQRQLHIYMIPFYYIDYCLAQTVALQFWALMQKDVRGAWDRYDALVSQAGTRTFTGLVESAGLDTPFGDGALHIVADAAMAWLDQADMETIQ